MKIRGRLEYWKYQNNTKVLLRVNYRLGALNSNVPDKTNKPLENDKLTGKFE